MRLRPDNGQAVSHDMINVSDELGLIGRLHPVLLHLPIGFLVFLGVIEAVAYSPRFAGVATARRLLLPLTVIATAVSAMCGWILSWSGEYDSDALAWHKWSGTALVVMVAALPALVRWGAMGVYRAWLGLTLTLLLVTGHYGNALVRGADYLFPSDWASAAETDNTPPGHDITVQQPRSAPFALLVQPVLNEYCIGCHGPLKSKAKLRLDSAEHLLKGGESGPVVQPGLALRSLLIKRLRLPLDADDHMPPEGKTQPSARDIALVELWINAGAPAETAGGEPTTLEAK